MPERQSRHPDNEFIREITEGGSVAEGGRSGGNLMRNIGTRAELNEALGTLEGDEVERAQGRDSPGSDAMKGSKTINHMQGGGSSPGN